MITVVDGRNAAMIVSSNFDRSGGQMYLNQACQAVNVDVLGNNSFVQLVPHMLFLVILGVYAKDPFGLKIKNLK